MLLASVHNSKEGNHFQGVWMNCRKIFFLNNRPDALIIQIYYVIKIYMLRASSLPIITISLLYIRHW